MMNYKDLIEAKENNIKVILVKDTVYFKDEKDRTLEEITIKEYNKMKQYYNVADKRTNCEKLDQYTIDELIKEIQ